MNIEYTQRIEKIEAELKRWLPEASANSQILRGWAQTVFPNAGKEISADEMEALLAPGRDILSRGGKRWRPLLMTLVCESLGGAGAALPFSPLVEFCHNASLIHDDIEDNSDQRRGKPSIHVIYGVDSAINCGSFLYFLSLSCIDNLENGEKKNRIYSLWADCMRSLHFGQAIDIRWHREISLVPSPDDYYFMSEMKTGSLSRFAAGIGAYAADASPETAREFGNAAEKLGIGFQILDDVKNLTTGNPGKKRGDDIIEGKKSYPVLLYLQKYPEKSRKVFYCFHQAKMNGISAPEAEDLIHALSETGVLAEAEEKGRSLTNEAREVFTSSGSVDKNAAGLLGGLIDMII
ncbi:MAG: polyprenyl synthetase family protein [Treponema sp.]|jgi:octaprenyl-diphosphate synthase|nr:polyprenyl synthetase family protein [Treponema sp.]